MVKFPILNREGKRVASFRFKAVVPPMVHKLSSAWNQPNPKNFLFDEKDVMMTLDEFEALADYSFSQPSGVYEGKMWKAKVWFRNNPGDNKVIGYWHLKWFDFCPDDMDKCSTQSRRIVLVTGKLPVYEGELK